MADITAAAVKAFREKTGLPMMDCKRALSEANGDEDVAMEILRKKGLAKMSEKMNERSTEEGTIAIVKSDKGTAIVEVLCESAPVATNPDFLQLANDIAAVVAENDEFASVEDLMAQASPSKPGMTLQAQLEELFNRIREVFRVNRYKKYTQKVSTYLHHDKKVGVLLLLEEGEDEAGRDICMHIAAMRPEGLSEADIATEVLDNEMRIQRELMDADPANDKKSEEIKEKILKGKMASFVAQKCLLSQEFVKDSSKKVGEYAQEAGLKITGFVHWMLGK